MTKLFTPIKVGRIELAHRVAMAPMTRFRADDQHVPLPFVKDYYVQRTAVPGSLAITEGVFISEKAGGYRNVPGIYSDTQIAAWKSIVDAVHEQGSYIFLQLWALGRTANPDVLKAESNSELVSASDIPKNADAVAPHPLTEQEIQQYIADFTQAGKNAITAGFDGVEIHGANGYLVDQFIKDVSNKRSDAWGGSIENRARFAIEVAKALSGAIGGDRVAIRLSPFGGSEGMDLKSDPVPQYTYLVEQLKQFKLAYIHFVESVALKPTTPENTRQVKIILDAYKNASPIILAGGYELESSKQAVDLTYDSYDVILGIGRPYTSNPDLPFRFRHGIELTPYQREFFFTPKLAQGFHDYPFSERFTQLKAKA